MTFAEAIQQLATKVDLDQQAAAKLRSLVLLLRAAPGLEDVLNMLVRNNGGGSTGGNT